MTLPAAQRKSLPLSQTRWKVSVDRLFISTIALTLVSVLFAELQPWLTLLLLCLLVWVPVFVIARTNPSLRGNRHLAKTWSLLPKATVVASIGVAWHSIQFDDIFDTHLLGALALIPSLTLMVVGCWVIFRIKPIPQTLRPMDSLFFLFFASVPFGFGVTGSVNSLMSSNIGHAFAYTVISKTDRRGERGWLSYVTVAGNGRSATPKNFPMPRDELRNLQIGDTLCGTTYAGGLGIRTYVLHNCTAANRSARTIL